MRHESNLIMALEGMTRAAFRIAEELAQNSRSGLTVRFLGKKLELPEEEVEYIVDLNHRLFFTDLTKVKLVPAGAKAIRRIVDGLGSHGDVESLFRRVRQLDKHDLHHLEAHLAIDDIAGKRQLVERLLERYYTHPDSVIEYVATRGFSPAAQEIFDAVWQSEDGLVAPATLRAARPEADYETERALWELCRGLALVEMFRFDGEDRLVRVVGLVKEIRQWRESEASRRAVNGAPKPHRGRPAATTARRLEFSERVLQLVAALAARPARVRGDGELFREDRRRLAEICPEDQDPSLTTCLWAAEGVGWLVRVDDELRAGNVDALVPLEPLARHKMIFDRLTAGGSEAESRRILASVLDDLKPGAWYEVEPFLRYALRRRVEDERPVLRNAGGWHYVSPSAVPGAERNLARSLEETLLWLGVVERTENGAASLFRLSDFGRAFLMGRIDNGVASRYRPKSARFVVQPNFDIVVPTQDTDPLLTVPLDQFAERRSTGVATVYTLTKESFTKGIQDGHDGDAFIAFLLAHNRGDLPANVLTTLEDWRGGVKRVRLRTVHILESDDPLVIADLTHRRRLSKHFQPLDPRKSVALTKISKAERAELVKELEKEGFVVN